MIKYRDLPKEFQNESVKKYYEIVSKKRLSLVFKRIFDIIFSVLTLIILLIPIFIISIAIKLDSKGSVFYRQERVTRYGKKFKIFKFRTMVSNADKIGTLVTVKSDSRITKVGKFLRKYRLDEFPQIFNIFLLTAASASRAQVILLPQPPE
ncbi:sugar transferase, partial [Parvimonas micra]